MKNTTAKSSPNKSKSNKRTIGAFTALNYVSNACNSIQNTVLLLPTTPSSDMIALNANIDVAKKLATEWIGGTYNKVTYPGIAPNMTASIPNSVISYGTLFNQATTDILALAPIGTTVKKGSANYKTIMEMVTAIKGQLAAEITSIETTESNMTTWGGKMQAIHTKLVTGADNIQNAETGLKSNITTMNSAIKTLNTEINNANKKLIKEESLTGAGIAVFVVGIVFTAGIASTAGAACIIAGSIEWAALKKTINTNFKQIGADQKQIGTDKARIVALKSVHSATEQTVSSIDIVTKNLSDVKTMWTFFKDQIEDVEKEVAKLKEGDPVDFSKELDIQVAQDLWKNVTKTANKLLTSAYKPPVHHTVNITK